MPKQRGNRVTLTGKNPTLSCTTACQARHPISQPFLVVVPLLTSVTFLEAAAPAKLPPKAPNRAVNKTFSCAAAVNITAFVQEQEF